VGAVLPIGVVEELPRSWRYGCGRGRGSGPSCVLLHPGSTTHARTSVGFAFKFAPTCWTPQQKYHPTEKQISRLHHPAHIIDSSTCNMSDTYSEVEKKIQQAVDEMRALEPIPVITDFAR
jgi:hypothetical protein